MGSPREDLRKEPLRKLYKRQRIQNGNTSFDNLWWPVILSTLRSRNCIRNQYRLLASYLQDRKVGIEDVFKCIVKALTKGAPQESVIGPDLWNLVFDLLLQIIEELDLEELFPKDQVEIDVVVYAADLGVVIQADSRGALERVGGNPYWLQNKRLVRYSQDDVSGTKD